MQKLSAPDRTSYTDPGANMCRAQPSRGSGAPCGLTEQRQRRNCAGRRSTISTRGSRRARSRATSLAFSPFLGHASFNICPNRLMLRHRKPSSCRPSLRIHASMSIPSFSVEAGERTERSTAFSRLRHAPTPRASGLVSSFGFLAGACSDPEKKTRHLGLLDADFKATAFQNHVAPPPKMRKGPACGHKLGGRWLRHHDANRHQGRQYHHPSWRGGHRGPTMRWVGFHREEAQLRHLVTSGPESFTAAVLAGGGGGGRPILLQLRQMQLNRLVNMGIFGLGRHGERH